ncbi:sterol desaturase family protein [Leptospira wolffii]|uniref:sterol desaturase family protein n=1 Tax=Leptospira wolffii TaxID=409998 RepID=UPI0010823EC2|nr:sterol desaturase family protein [Leptospira wolffii]TGK61741.1 sterol desaturase family protein [Leptospira wolffii]TGK70284.1 sterol desaturase family protein [Leptospira wolffii]TGK77207.1 sterol desaturase family protein [Leptospira wolffii]TGL30940.1 sterol desaturase family protein [Leptospira wolffii]
MEKNIIELLTPVFFVLVLVEVFFSIFNSKDLYRFKDSVNNLSAGVFMQVFTVFITLGLMAVYTWIYSRFGIFSISNDSWIGWVLCFILADFFYYWYHRYGHEINIFWASHVAHHQSEDYNFTVALRQGVTQNTFSLPFYLPLAFLGFPPIMFMLCIQINFAYQFWLHTRAIPKLGIIEWVFNTPSQHRVHHGRNPKYIDKNYAGTFSVWDRMFGSFKEEEEEPIFGIVKPMQTWSPLWAQFHYFEELILMSLQTKSWKNKFLVWVKPPGWKPADLGESVVPPEIDRSNYKKFDTKIPYTLTIYTILQFLFGMGASMIYIEFKKELPLLEMVVLGFYILWTLWNIGAIFELKTSGMVSELIRLASIAALTYVYPFDFTHVEKLTVYLSQPMLQYLPVLMKEVALVSFAVLGGFLISQKRFFSIKGYSPKTV